MCVFSEGTTGAPGSMPPGRQRMQPRRSSPRTLTRIYCDLAGGADLVRGFGPSHARAPLITLVGGRRFFLARQCTFKRELAAVLIVYARAGFSLDYVMLSLSRTVVSRKVDM